MTTTVIEDDIMAERILYVGYKSLRTLLKCLALIFSLIIIIQFLLNYIINATIIKAEFGISEYLHIWFASPLL